MAETGRKATTTSFFLLQPACFKEHVLDRNRHETWVAMEDSKEVTALKKRIQALEEENRRLKLSSGERSVADSSKSENDSKPSDRLSNTEIERYSRQLLLRGGFGVTGQKKLLSASVLVVGAGGIGSTGECVGSPQEKTITFAHSSPLLGSHPLFGGLWCWENHHC